MGSFRTCTDPVITISSLKADKSPGNGKQPSSLHHVSTAQLARPILGNSLIYLVRSSPRRCCQPGGSHILHTCRASAQQREKVSTCHSASFIPFTSGVLDSLFCQTKGVTAIESRLVFLTKEKKKIIEKSSRCILIVLIQPFTALH